MTLKHFISAPYKIPIGEFGTKPTKIKCSNLNINKKIKKSKRIFSKNNEENVNYYKNEIDHYGYHLNNGFEAHA